MLQTREGLCSDAHKSYLYPAVLGGDRSELPAVLVAGTHPGTGQTRVQNRSPHGCRLPAPSEKPAGRRAAGTHTRYPNWKGKGDAGESQLHLHKTVQETATTNWQRPVIIKLFHL